MSGRFEPHDYAVHLKSLGYKKEAGTLYLWTGTHWNALSESEAEEMAYHWLADNQREHASTRNSASAVGAALHWCDSLEKTTEDVTVPCANGYVQIVGGEIVLVDATPSMGIRHVIGCDYGATPESASKFMEFILTTLPDVEVRRRVQEYIGYTLTSDTRYQRAQLWLGTGANGKGVFANIVQALHKRTESVRLNSLNGFGISKLIGASLIYSDEMPLKGIDEQLLKSLIAGEMVQVDRKYRDPVSTKISGKWLALGNHLPVITDHSTGFWRRFDVVPFTVTVAEGKRDPMLAKYIIDHELSGVLSWALDGLVRLQQRGGFDPILPSTMSAVLQSVKAESNVVKAWCDDCEIGLTSDTWTAKDTVYAQFRVWCERNGVRADASPIFWKKLGGLLQYQEKRMRDGASFVRVCSVDLRR